MSINSYVPTSSIKWFSILTSSKRLQIRTKRIVRRARRLAFLEKLEDRNTAGAALPLPLSLLAEAINIKSELPSSDNAIKKLLAAKEVGSAFETSRRAPRPDWSALPANRFERPFAGSLWERSGFSSVAAAYGRYINQLNESNFQQQASNADSPMTFLGQRINGMPIEAGLGGEKTTDSQQSQGSGSIGAEGVSSSSGSGGGSGVIATEPTSRDDTAPRDTSWHPDTSGGGGGGGNRIANDDSPKTPDTATQNGQLNQNPTNANATDSASTTETVLPKPVNDPPEASVPRMDDMRSNVPTFASNAFQSVHKTSFQSDSAVAQYIHGSFQIANTESEKSFTLEAWNASNSLITRSSVTPVDGIGLFEFTVGSLPSLSNEEIKLRLVGNEGRVLAESATLSQTNLADSDADGVSDSIEKGRSGSQDRNHDGTADYLQASVANILAAKTGPANFFTLDGKGHSIHDAKVLAVPSHLSELIAPHGMLDFKITGLEIGAHTSVDLFLENPSSITSFGKYDPATGAYSDFSFDGQTGAIVNKDRISLYFVDGGRGDADGIANGIIHDPFIPGGSAIDVSQFLTSANLSSWTSFESGGTAGNLGSIISQGNDVVLAENSSYVVGLKRLINVGASPNILRFRYEPVQFDYTAFSQIKDAFEVALIDGKGIPLVNTFVQPNRDAFLNVSESVAIDSVSLKENSMRAVGAFETQVSPGGGES